MRARALTASVLTVGVVLGGLVVASPADAHSSSVLTPATHFTMQPDGSSGLTDTGAEIPNIDSVKKTIATYYGDPGTGIADKADSPYIREMDALLAKQAKRLPSIYRHAVAHHEKPAIVFDADDTTLETYDMEVAAMHFVFDPTLQDEWVQDERFPATPGMVEFVATAKSLGFSIFGITGRNANQEAATLGNLEKVGYDAFDADNFYTKWVGDTKPDYVTCATTSCTTVEYKAYTRKHIESLGYDIALNVGDQWSDLQGGFSDAVLKLPNPTYYLPSADLPGLTERSLTPRTRFVMQPDGSSGATQGGEGIPNIDSVKSTIRAYYGDTGTGIASRTDSAYLDEMAAITTRQTRALVAECRVASRQHHGHEKPAVVFDADDTTLWTYDMEAGAMKFVYSPTLQNEWVQDERFDATPGMVSLVSAVADAGCTVFGLTGRNDDQKTATLANLTKVGYADFTADHYFTKWTGTGASQQPSYIHCAAASCTTVEYKSQTRAHIERLGYDIVANVGDQFSDLQGGHADRSIKLPNPTYYLP